MDLHARMNENAGPYKGLDRYEAREAVLADLKEQGFLVAEKDYTLPSASATAVARRSSRASPSSGL